MREVFEFLTQYGYILLFVWVFAEQIGLPIPALPILLGMGAMAGMNRMNFAFALILSVIAAVSADALWYELGRRRGAKVLTLLCRISLEPDSCVRRAEDVFAKYGPRTLLVAKFIPGLNVAAPPMSAVVRMGLGRFLLYDGLGALLWASSFGLIGYAFGHQVEDILKYAGRIATLLLWLILAFIVMHIYWRYRQRRAFLWELEMARVTPEQLRAALDRGDDVFIVDLRHPLDFLAYPCTIGNALRMAPEELERRHLEIPRDRDIVLYCT